MDKLKRIETAIASAWVRVIGRENWLHLEIPEVHKLTGWARVEDCPNDYSPYDKNFFETSTVKGFFRPLALERLENNNGWNLIETEEDLPQIRWHLKLYLVLSYEPQNGKQDARADLFNRERFTYENVINLYHAGKITHWRLDNDFLPVY